MWCSAKNWPGKAFLTLFSIGLKTQCKLIGIAKALLFVKLLSITHSFFWSKMISYCFWEVLLKLSCTAWTWGLRRSLSQPNWKIGPQIKKQYPWFMSLNLLCDNDFSVIGVFWCISLKRDAEIRKAGWLERRQCFQQQFWKAVAQVSRTELVNQAKNYKIKSTRPTNQANFTGGVYSTDQVSTLCHDKSCQTWIRQAMLSDCLLSCKISFCLSAPVTKVDLA